MTARHDASAAQGNNPGVFPVTSGRPCRRRRGLESQFDVGGTGGSCVRARTWDREDGR
jgi:hypothetical protein